VARVCMIVMGAFFFFVTWMDIFDMLNQHSFSHKAFCTSITMTTVWLFAGVGTSLWMTSVKKVAGNACSFTYRCLVSELLSLRLLWQYSQIWGLSPECVHIWIVNADLYAQKKMNDAGFEFGVIQNVNYLLCTWMNLLPQPLSWHWNRRSLVWIR
jgi:hypothetical protein